MKKYQLKVIVELNEGELSGTELLTAVVFANTKEEDEIISSGIRKKYINESMFFKYFPKLTIGTSVINLEN